jgi:hypothetical protein
MTTITRLAVAPAPRTDVERVSHLNPPRPVFVIGSQRSGASLLGLSLGQHPNLMPVLKTNWFDYLAMGLQQAYSEGIRPRSTSHLDISGIELDDFFAFYGEATNRLMLGQWHRHAGDVSSFDGGADPRDRSALIPPSSYRPTRWVDSTTSNAEYVFVLLKLFPLAKFIFVLRDVGSEVASLTNAANRRLYKSGREVLTSAAAYTQWLETVTPCVQAERAFGSGTVLRIYRSDLVQSPEPIVRQCLDFLGEPFAQNCLRPFNTMSVIAPKTNVSAVASLEGRDAAIGAAAELLSSLLMAEGTPCYPRDEEAIWRLDKQWNARVSRRRKQSQIEMLEQATEALPHQSPVRSLIRSVKGLVANKTALRVPVGARGADQAQPKE